MYQNYLERPCYNEFMNEESLVSIIVPIYNNASYLPECIESICGQKYSNIEIILVDDGSTDNTADIIKEYQKKDSRIISIYQKNSGQSSARNAGIRISRGDYICFVDSDDVISKTFVSDALEFISENDLVVCGIQYNKIKEGTSKAVYINKLREKKDSESIEEYVLYLLTVDGRMYSSVNKIYRADVIRKNDLKFAENLDFAEDSRFVLDYVKCAGRIGFILKPNYHYHLGTINSTVMKSGVKWENWKNFYVFLKEWVGNNPTKRAKFLLKTVYLRWKISYVRSCRRARK